MQMIGFTLPSYVWLVFCLYSVFKDIDFKLSEKDIEIVGKNWEKCLKVIVLININFNVG